MLRSAGFATSTGVDRRRREDSVIACTHVARARQLPAPQWRQSARVPQLLRPDHPVARHLRAEAKLTPRADTSCGRLLTCGAAEGWAASVVMDVSAAPGGDTPGRALSEERLQRLEVQVEALMEAVGVLARALEGGPAPELQSVNTEEAARRAHELLLLAKSASGQRP